MSFQFDWKTLSHNPARIIDHEGGTLIQGITYG